MPRGRAWAVLRLLHLNRSVRMEVRVISKTLHTAQPDADDVAVAQHALVSLRKVLSVHPNDEMVALKIEETDEELTLPRFALDLLL
jgi:hypothetical protein